MISIAIFNISAALQITYIYRRMKYRIKISYHSQDVQGINCVLSI